MDPRTPVLVGVGQITNYLDRSSDLTQRPEPAELMAQALHAAAEDSGGRDILSRAHSLRVMIPLSWRYKNPALLVAERLGISPSELAASVIGGNSPQTIANDSALAILAGSLDVVLLVGADCIATRIAARRDPTRPVLNWTTQPEAVTAPRTIGVDREPVTETEKARSLDRPLRVFPLFENALRAAAREDIETHQRKVAELWARISEVSVGNIYAWSRRRYSADEIRSVGPDNRMVSFPYPKLMNANDRVDQAAALIMCSYEAAYDAGVPREKMVFPLAGADAHDHWFLTHRDNFRSSPALRLAARSAFDSAGLGVDDATYVDLYSCFPCAVQIGAAEVGLDTAHDNRALTVTGGLAFAGGPGNNYMGHSIATMAACLREDGDAVGLVTGVGWYMTKHTVGLWAASPPAGGFHYSNPQAEVDALPQRAPADDLSGELTVETYTVVFDRDEEPFAILALLTGDGKRAWANLTTSDSIKELTESEGCGRTARFVAEGRLELR